jgi:type III pantothenate kinase
MSITSEKWLLIDNSNTRTKLVFADASGLLSEVSYIPTAELSVGRIAEVVADSCLTKVVICSVVPSCREIFLSAFSVAPHFLSVDSPMKMEFDYEGTPTLGADRIANALAVADLFAVTSIVVDAGTATTFDVVENKGDRIVYKGGVIAPGIDCFASYLHQCTAALPRVQVIADCPPIGANTTQAMQAGALYGFCGMVQGILSAMAAGFSLPPLSVFTGGDAQLLLSHGVANARFEKYLTLYGLLHVARLL